MLLRAELLALAVLGALPLYAQPRPASSPGVRVRFTSTAGRFHSSPAFRGSTLSPSGLPLLPFPTGLGLSAGFATAGAPALPLDHGLFPRNDGLRVPRRHSILAPFFSLDQGWSPAVLVVPQVVEVPVSVSSTAEAGRPATQASTGPRIELSPYLRREKRNSDWSRALLGITPDEIEGAAAIALGASATGAVLIREVAPGSPAAEAGLQPGDAIVSVDGSPIRTVDDLRLRLRQGFDPENISMRLLRRGVQFSVILHVD